MTPEPGIRAQIEELSRRSDLPDVEKFARYRELAELEIRSLEDGEKVMAYDKDMKTGREAKDSQMKALQKAHGTPTPQRDLPPYISKDKLPVDPRVETD